MRVRAALIPVLVTLCAIAHAQQVGTPAPVSNPTVCGYPTMRVTEDGRQLATRAIVRGGRAYFPIRAAVASSGEQVRWRRSRGDHYMAVPARGRTIRFRVGSRTVRIYRYSRSSRSGAGRLLNTVTLDAPIIRCAGDVYAPVRSVVTAAGGTVRFDRQAMTLDVSLPAGEPGR